MEMSTEDAVDVAGHSIYLADDLSPANQKKERLRPWESDLFARALSSYCLSPEPTSTRQADQLIKIERDVLNTYISESSGVTAKNFDAMLRKSQEDRRTSDEEASDLLFSGSLAFGTRLT